MLYHCLEWDKWVLVNFDQLHKAGSYNDSSNYSPSVIYLYVNVCVYCYTFIFPKNIVSWLEEIFNIQKVRFSADIKCVVIEINIYYSGYY